MPASSAPPRRRPASAGPGLLRRRARGGTQSQPTLRSSAASAAGPAAVASSSSSSSSAHVAYALGGIDLDRRRQQDLASALRHRRQQRTAKPSRSAPALHAGFNFEHGPTTTTTTSRRRPHTAGPAGRAGSSSGTRKRGGRRRGRPQTAGAARSGGRPQPSRGTLRPSSSSSSSSSSLAHRRSMPALKHIPAHLRADTVSRLAAVKPFDPTFHSRLLSLEVEFNERVRLLPSPVRDDTEHNAAAPPPPPGVTAAPTPLAAVFDDREIDDVGTASSRYSVYEELFEDIIAQDPLFAHLLRRVKTEYDRQIAVLTRVSFARRETRQKKAQTRALKREARARRRAEAEREEARRQALQGRKIAAGVVGGDVPGAETQRAMTAARADRAALSQEEEARRVEEDDAEVLDDLLARQNGRMRMQIEHLSQRAREAEAREAQWQATLGEKDEQIDTLQAEALQWRQWVQRRAAREAAREEAAAEQQQQREEAAETAAVAAAAAAEADAQKTAAAAEAAAEAAASDFSYKMAEAGDGTSPATPAAAAQHHGTVESALREEVRLLRAALAEHEEGGSLWDGSVVSSASQQLTPIAGGGSAGGSEGDTPILPAASALRQQGKAMLGVRLGVGRTPPPSHTPLIAADGMTPPDVPVALKRLPPTSSYHKFAAASMHESAVGVLAGAGGSGGGGGGSSGGGGLPPPGPPSTTPASSAAAATVAGTAYSSSSSSSSSSSNNNNNTMMSLPLSRSNVMLMDIPEGDEALVSPGEASEAAMSAANAPAGSVPGSRRNLSFSLNSGRSLGGRSVVSELSEASAMSVSPRSHFGMEDDAEEGGRGGHSDVPHLNLALSAPLPSK